MKELNEDTYVIEPCTAEDFDTFMRDAHGDPGQFNVTSDEFGNTKWMKGDRVYGEYVKGTEKWLGFIYL